MTSKRLDQFAPVPLDAPAVHAHEGSQVVERAGHSLGGDVPVGTRLGKRAEHAKEPLTAIGLAVESPDDAVAHQERQHVVAELPLGRRGVDLELVREIEEALAALAKPHDRIERR